MSRSFKSDYIEISNEFRKSNASRESVEKLYDLLYELENSKRTSEEDLILSYIYSLLGFHLSAYEIFKSVADVKDKKASTKLYAMETKAKSHKNNFTIKDLRKFRQKNASTVLLTTDFLVPGPDDSTAPIITKDIVIFNKVVKSDKVEILLYGNHTFEQCRNRIIDLIYFLGDIKRELIEFYNKELSKVTESVADDDWYDTLQIFSVRVNVGPKENISADISCGDDIWQDHLLDVEIENETVVGMSYDG